MIRAGVGTQLAAFTTEGLIRAGVRTEDRSTWKPVPVLWHAYVRWAVGQAIPEVLARNPWENHSDPWDLPPGAEWPDGWLSQVPALRERRGSAPTTVAALAGGQPGTPEVPISQSAGAQGLIRVLPAAALVAKLDRSQVKQGVEDLVAMTHGSPDAGWPSVEIVLIAGQSLISGLDPVSAMMETRLVQMGSFLGRARDVAQGKPSDVRTLAGLAPKATCESALSAAIYAVCSHPGAGAVMDALHLAAAAPHGASAAAVTGALLGAAHGAEVWPVDWLARHELTWPLDTLGRDLARQLLDGDSAGGSLRGADEPWWPRYPGH